MRKSLAGLALVAALTLGGCVTIGNINSIIAQVQAHTATACKIVADAKTIRDIWATGKFNSVFALAEALCAAVGKKSAARGSRPMVAGVVVKYRRVR